MGGDLRPFRVVVPPSDGGRGASFIHQVFRKIFPRGKKSNGIFPRVFGLHRVGRVFHHGGKQHLILGSCHRTHPRGTL